MVKNFSDFLKESIEYPVYNCTVCGREYEQKTKEFLDFGYTQCPNCGCHKGQERIWDRPLKRSGMWKDEEYEKDNLKESKSAGSTLEKISRAKDGCLKEEDMSKKELALVEDLVKQGLVKKSKDGYCLTKKGIIAL